MKLKELFSTAKNSKNNQEYLCLRKRKIKKENIDMKKILDMELNDDDFLI